MIDSLAHLDIGNTGNTSEPGASLRVGSPDGQAARQPWSGKSTTASDVTMLQFSMLARSLTPNGLRCFAHGKTIQPPQPAGSELKHIYRFGVDNILAS